MTTPLDADRHDGAALMRSLAQEATALADAYRRATAVQWDPAPVLRPREDTTERAKGGHGDPTVSVVTDPARLRVRLAVIGAERVLRAAALDLRAAVEALDAAVEEWETGRH